uniref:GM2 ganglioside activator n=1 Tax=Apteryx owenii TaxID=8824 RepID=A0A8B9QFG4_APTOW
AGEAFLRHLGGLRLLGAVFASSPVWQRERGFGVPSSPRAASEVHRGHSALGTRGQRPGGTCGAESESCPSTPQVGGFSWENCGDGKDPVVLQSLSVAPDPITIPGSLRISAAVTSAKALTSPLKAVVVVEKELGELWIQLPCIDQLGSCTYSDVCTILDNLIPPGMTCPEPLLTYGIPCHCPFKAGSYSLPASDFPLPDIELPSWMTNGNYRVRAAVSNNGEELACVKLAFSLQAQ